MQHPDSAGVLGRHSAAAAPQVPARLLHRVRLGRKHGTEHALGFDGGRGGRVSGRGATVFLRILLRGKHGVSLARGKETGWIDYGRGKWEPEERESDFDFLWRAQSPRLAGLFRVGSDSV